MLVLTMCASAALAIFPGYNGFTFPNTVGDGYLTFKMQQGWVQGYPAWYICTDTNDIRFAQTQNLTLAPKLSSAFFGAGAAAMFIVLNPAASQGPVFETWPGQALYTPIWRVRYVTWNPGANKVPLTSIGQILALAAANQLEWVDTNIRVDCSILAVYRLGGAFMPKPPPFYRIPQGRIVAGIGNTQYIRLPYWNVYCRNPITRRIEVQRVIIPDAYPAKLAQIIGANIAPALPGLDVNNRQTFYTMNWAQDWNAAPGIQPLKILVNQYPLICDCPSDCSWRNTNYNYSPVTSFVLLDRNVAANPNIVETLFNNCEFLRQQIAAGNLIPVKYPTPPLQVAPVTLATPVASFVLNSPVICGDL
jgi:hypothetical protein